MSGEEGSDIVGQKPASADRSQTSDTGMEEYLGTLNNGSSVGNTSVMMDPLKTLQGR